MPRNPKSKAVDSNTQSVFGNILYRTLIPFEIPTGFDGNLWRFVSRKQPVIMDCITTLIMYAQNIQWDIRARDSNQADELKESAKEHKKILSTAQNGAGLLVYLGLLLQDFYMTPFGAATETIRYSDGRLYKIRSIDSATLFPSDNELLPIKQIVGINNPIFFSQDEMVRMYQFPRPELERRGWGMTPAEKIYLAVELLTRGDRYYANLLLDTPEAGLLDLGDMSRESAMAWLDGLKALFSGIDGFKIPVIYEHTTPAKYIPFGRPPTDMLFNDTTIKYAQLTTASFGLTIGDIGLKQVGGSLSQAIRDERHSKATGYNNIKTFLVNHINSFLPEELEFWIIDTDDELLVAKGRARSANAVAMRNYVEGGILTPNEARRQVKADGLITIPLDEEAKEEDFEIVKEISGMADQIALQERQLDIQEKQAANANKLSSGVQRRGGQAGTGLNKRRNLRGGKLETVQGKEPVPASSGGQGEIKSIIERADDNAFRNMLIPSFTESINKLDSIRAKRIIKAGIKLLYPTLRSLNNENVSIWKFVYQHFLFGFTDSIFEDALITKAATDNIDSLDEFIQKDKWWEVALDDSEIGEILAEAYANGLRQAAEFIQESLYEDGLVDKPDVKENFTVEDDAIFAAIMDRADFVAKSINDGTKYFITRLAMGTIADVIESPVTLEILRNAESVDDFLKNEYIIQSAITTFIQGFGEIMNKRTNDIPEFELKSMFEAGKLAQYKFVGFTKKAVIHVGSDDPCEVCLENENLGFVPMNFKYRSRMGYDVDRPIFHLNCHDELIFDKSELPNIKNHYMTGK